MIVSLMVLALQAAEPPAPVTPAPAPTAGQPAAAQPSANVVSQATVTAEPVYGIVEGKNAPKPKIVCFKDPVLGSKIPTKRCMPREEFLQRQLETKEYLNNFQTNVSIPTP